MLTEICQYLKNWFNRGQKKIFGEFTIQNNQLNISDIQTGQYYRIIGSVFNDGVHKKGSEALIDIKCSQSLVDEVIKLGGKPIYIRTGNPFIKAAMRKRKIPFSGEMSGHIFFADEYYGFDDGTYAAARFLRILHEQTKGNTNLFCN